MNKKFYFSCFICIFTFILSTTFYFNSQTIIKSENRTVTTFPDFPQKISTSKIHHFFAELTNFYNDNFPHRETIILTLTTLIPSVNSGINILNKVVTGKNNWLFLGNDYTNTLDKLTGKFYYHNSKNKNEDVTNRYNYYNKIVNKLSSSHNKIFFLIGPNKTSVYPEYLPQYIVPAAKPFHDQLMQKMNEEGLTVCYPRQNLLQAKEKALLYYVTDTHWNYYGAFIAFIHLISQFDPTFSNVIKKEEFSFKELNSYPGDLIKIGNLQFKNKNYHDNFQPYYKNSPIPQPESIFTSRKLNPPIQKYTNNNALLNKTLLVIGDSFTTALSPYFSLSFKNWHFIHRNDFNKITSEQLAVIHADFILYETVEREF